jgi:cyclic-di-GMP-binding protein
MAAIFADRVVRSMAPIGRRRHRASGRILAPEPLAARPDMPSFDTVLEPNLVELRNAVEQSNKEIGTRFDFKGSSARIESTESGKTRQLELHADSDFQIAQVKDILLAKLSKRGLDVRFIDFGAKIEKMGGDKVRLTAPVKQGIDSDTARKIQTLIKQSKLKVQAAIQGDAVRITGAKRDELQAAIALLRKEVADVPLSFNNFRD